MASNAEQNAEQVKTLVDAMRNQIKTEREGRLKAEAEVEQAHHLTPEVMSYLVEVGKEVGVNITLLPPAGPVHTA